MAGGGGYCEGRSQKKIPKARKPKKSKWLPKLAIDIADKRREAKTGQAHPDEVRKLNAEFQRQARKDKEDYLNRACKEIEDENRKGKTRDLFKKSDKSPENTNPGLERSKARQEMTFVKKDM